MANLYKKPVVIKDPKIGQKIKTKSKKWWGRFRDENGCEKRVPLAADKTAAQAMLNERVKKVERRLAGLFDPYEHHRKRPLAATSRNSRRTWRTRDRPTIIRTPQSSGSGRCSRDAISIESTRSRRAACRSSSPSFVLLD